MKVYFRSRHVLTAAVAILAATAAGLPLRNAWSLNREESLIVFPLGLIATLIVVMAFTLTLSGRFEQFEALGSRSRALWRAIHAVPGVALVVAATAAAGAIALHIPPHHESTVGDLAPIRAVLGMLGIALTAAAFLDIRIAAVTPIPFFVLPLSLNPGTVPAGEVWGFVLAPADSNAAWATAAVLSVLGTSTYVLGYRERAAPALTRTRISRRRTASQLS